MSEDVKTNPTAPFQRDSQTSIEAAKRKNKKDRVTERLRVYNFIKSQGDHGATRQEIALALGKEINEICPRVWELLGSGGKYRASIYESVQRRMTAKNRSAAVLKVGFFVKRIENVYP